MAKLVKEITSGNQLTLSGGPTSPTSGSATRVFRIILDQPGEVVSAQDLCGIGIGSAHPNLTDSFCTSVETRYDGESRMALLCTFQYDAETTQSGDNNNDKEPGTRPANWSTTTSLIEVPVYRWRERTALQAWGDDKPAVNPAKDIYDAATQLTGLLNINMSLEYLFNPLQFNKYIGYVNSKTIKLDQLDLSPHTVMFRGVNSQPFVEEWNGRKYKGWRAAFEFAYKPNVTRVYIDSISAELEVELGWDIAVPQTGFNVIASAALAQNPGGFADADVFGQPLKHKDGRVVKNGASYSLPDNMQGGDRARAMVRVFEYEDGGISQSPSASPIPLNKNGVARSPSADPPVIVYGYSVQPEIDMVDIFKLRLP